MDKDRCPTCGIRLALVTPDSFGRTTPLVVITYAPAGQAIVSRNRTHGSIDLQVLAAREAGQRIDVDADACG